MPPKPDHSMFDDIWNESSFAGAIYDIGFEDGLKQAREEVRMAGMRALAQKVLERRFGSLDADLIGTFWAADKASLVDVLSNLTTLEELKARLGIA